MIIYKIKNKINGKIYIGQTKKDLNKRIIKHIRTNKYYIQKALNKYGLGSFTISIIDEAVSQDILDKKEKYWIRFYDCKAPNGYNCTDGGDGIKGYEYTEEHRKKSRESHLGKKLSKETRNKISLGNKGKRRSEEHKKILSITKLGKRFSEEHRNKLSIARSGKNHHMYGKHLSNETKRKIGEANSKKHPSEETKQKLREANLGKHHSEETKLKMRLSNYNTGKKLSIEQREKIKISWVIRKQRKIICE